MAIKWEEQWAETFALLLVVTGFILSILLRNALLSYVSVLVSGFIAGRIYYIKKYKEPILPFVLMIVGFLLGYLIGSFWTSRILTLVFFMGAFVLSYYLHVKEIVTIFKSENFFK